MIGATAPDIWLVLGKVEQKGRDVSFQGSQSLKLMLASPPGCLPDTKVTAAVGNVLCDTPCKQSGRARRMGRRRLWAWDENSHWPAKGLRPALSLTNLSIELCTAKFFGSGSLTSDSGI